MMEFKVEKKIPLPTKPANHFFPFVQMKKGDSFFVKKGVIANSVLYSILSQQKVKYGRYFTSRAVEGGRRVWRIK